MQPEDPALCPGPVSVRAEILPFVLARLTGKVLYIKIQETRVLAPAKIAQITEQAEVCTSDGVLIKFRKEV